MNFNNRLLIRNILRYTAYASVYTSGFVIAFALFFSIVAAAPQPIGMYAVILGLITSYIIGICIGKLKLFKVQKQQHNDISLLKKL